MELFTQRLGTGPRTVVLLHGFLGSGRNLSSLARKWLEADPSRSFLLCDLTGHGSSPALPEGATLATLADDVLETAEKQGVLDPLSIVGHSLGGRVALKLRERHPSRAGALSLLDIAPGPVHAGADEGGRILRALTSTARTAEDYATRDEARATLSASGIEKPLVEWLLMNLVSKGDRYAWRIDWRALERFRPELTQPDLWSAIAHDSGRIACVRGGRSPYVTAVDEERLNANGVEVFTIPDAGHFVHMDKPGELVQLLAREHRD